MDSAELGHGGRGEQELERVRFPTPNNNIKGVIIIREGEKRKGKVT